MTNSSIDENSFKRILRRNVALPLGVGVLSAVFFVTPVSYTHLTLPTNREV